MRHATIARSIAGLSCAILLVGGCTTTTITPLETQKPSEIFTTVELGNIEVQDPMWQSEVEHFRHGFVARLTEAKAFATVKNPAEGALPSQAIAVSGRITEIDKGDRALRFLIGLGAGRARVEGQFQIVDSTGAVLAKFTGAKAYSGGAGIGGADFLDIDDLMEKFGADTADAVTHWSKGQAIDAMNN